MMDGEDGARSQKSTSSAGRFVFPAYERPMDLHEANDALNVANIEVKDGAYSGCEKERRVYRRIDPIPSSESR